MRDAGSQTKRSCSSQDRACSVKRDPIGLPLFRRLRSRITGDALSAPAPPPSSATPRVRCVRLVGFVTRRLRMTGRLLLQGPPVFDRVRPVAVDVQPGDRLAQHRAMQKRPLRPDRRLEIDQPRLQGENLLQSLDVAPGDGQQPEFDAPFECIRRKPPAGDEPERR